MVRRGGAGFKYSSPGWCPRETPAHLRIPGGGMDTWWGWVTEAHGRWRGSEGTAQPHLQPGPLEELEPGGTRHRGTFASSSAPSRRKGQLGTPTADAGQAGGANLGPGLRGLQTRAWQDPSGPSSPGHWPGDRCGLGLFQDRAGAPGAAGPLSVSPSPPRGSRTPAPFSSLWPRAEWTEGLASHVHHLPAPPGSHPHPQEAGPGGPHHSHQHPQGVTPLHQEAGPGGCSLLAPTPPGPSAPCLPSPMSLGNGGLSVRVVMWAQGWGLPGLPASLGSSGCSCGR